ncbi:hypothetical protein NG895_13605, partial [Aeoliella sp. ICT_H6.2]
WLGVGKFEACELVAGIHQLVERGLGFASLAVSTITLLEVPRSDTTSIPGDPFNRGIGSQV